jgi:hypothetical protein
MSQEAAASDEALSGGFLKGNSGRRADARSGRMFEESSGILALRRSMWEWWCSQTVAGGGCR